MMNLSRNITKILRENFTKNFENIEQKHQFLDSLSFITQLLCSSNETIIYDECVEFKRLIQLEKEMMLSEIKKSQGFDINADDEILDYNVVNKLNSECNKLYDIIDNYKNQQKNLKSNTENKEEILEEIEFLESFILNFFDISSSLGRKIKKKIMYQIEKKNRMNFYFYVY